jgi:hypothetical protein
VNGPAGRRHYVTTGPRAARGPIRRGRQRLRPDRSAPTCSSCPIYWHISICHAAASSTLACRRSSGGLWAGRSRRMEHGTAAPRPGGHVRGWTASGDLGHGRMRTSEGVSGVGSGAADGPPRKQHLPLSLTQARPAPCPSALPDEHLTRPRAGDPLRPWWPAGRPASTSASTHES